MCTHMLICVCNREAKGNGNQELHEVKQSERGACWKCDLCSLRKHCFLASEKNQFLSQRLAQVEKHKLVTEQLLPHRKLQKAPMPFLKTEPSASQYSIPAQNWQREDLLFQSLGSGWSWLIKIQNPSQDTGFPIRASVHIRSVSVSSLHKLPPQKRHCYSVCFAPRVCHSPPAGQEKVALL